MKQRRRRSQGGQALVEYVMLLIMCGLVSVTINQQIKRGIGTLWLAMAKDIVPGCPGCELPDEIRR